MKFYKLDVGGNPLIGDASLIAGVLETELENMEVGDTYTVEAVEMTQQEVNDLPEWDGP